ncbi:hypothetical protein HID58_086391 [Brassica napus]|uniref:Uncharacterized protein n=1 Tax=Brassica napus TaxID=3708 RepID=A0ABQ7XQB5_BRANA|nr:hypothetical protein HID58_086391 [Brassica napus]
MDKRITNGDEGNQKVAFYKLFRFADRYDIILMAVGTISAMANGLAQPIMSVLIGKIINVFGFSDHDHMVKEVSKVALKFLYLAVYACVVSFLQVSCWKVTGERQSARIRVLYLKTILRQDIGFFDTETSTGWEICTVNINILWWIHSRLRLTVALIPCIPLIVATGGAMALIMSKMVGRGLHAYAEAGNVIEQAVGSIRTVVAFTREKQATQKHEKKVEIAYKSMVQQGLFSGLGLGIMMVVSYCTYGIAIWYGAWLIMEKGYTGGQVMNVIFAILGGGMSLGQTLPSLNAFAAGQAAAYKMFETIKTKPKIDAYSMTGKVLDEIKGDIELKDVYFRYPARPDVQIFAGFSLVVPNGTTVALVGQSGSGKSTVISLIERFYDPESGEVLIDGIALKKLQLRWIRSKIGLVSQEPILFATTIRENIVYGKEDASDEEIRTAVKLANATRFVDKLPQGLDTMVGDHGTQLSGGQKQRLAIARAILKNPKILLLDEATSALDAESERTVQDALVKLMSTRTIIAVAHRLTTIKTASMIAVVQQGKIIEKGTHEEMIQDPEGAYSQLVSLQEVSKKGGVEELELRENISGCLCLALSRYSSSLRSTTGVIGARLSTDASVEKYQEASQVASDAVSSIRTVASFCAEDKVMDLYQQKCEAPKKQGVRLGLVSGSGYGISFLALYCINSLCFYVGSWLIQKRIATFGEFFQVFFAITMTALAVSQTSAMAPDRNKAKDSAAYIFEILDSKPKIDSSSNEGAVLPIVHGHVEFQHVSFRYPTRPDIQIFSDLCLTISSGQTVALVGESESGKSTVISLIERFYDPDSGKVLLDQVDVRILKLSWLRQQMGLTIRSNIAYGKTGEATEEEIITAAKAANAHNFISTLPQGYETSVGERGVQLSGGQKQRIAIARAILKDPKVLLLDEATSALDAESERVVQDALDSVMVNRTTVVVAHRLSMIKNADVIAVVKDGVIAERGRHETLMEISGGAYASLLAFHMSAN